MTKIYFFAIALVLLPFRAYCEDYKPSIQGLTSTICIERPENHGSLDIYPAVVRFSNWQSITLIGDQASCIFVKPGDYTIQAESKDPYDPNNSNPWSSSPIEITTERDQTTIIELTPDESKKMTWKLKQ